MRGRGLRRLGGRKNGIELNSSEAVYPVQRHRGSRQGSRGTGTVVLETNLGKEGQGGIRERRQLLPYSPRKTRGLGED